MHWVVPIQVRRCSRLVCRAHASPLPSAFRSEKKTRTRKSCAQQRFSATRSRACAQSALALDDAQGPPNGLMYARCVRHFVRARRRLDPLQVVDAPFLETYPSRLTVTYRGVRQAYGSVKQVALRCACVGDEEAGRANTSGRRGRVCAGQVWSWESTAHARFEQGGKKLGRSSCYRVIDATLLGCLRGGGHRAIVLGRRCW